MSLKMKITGYEIGCVSAIDEKMCYYFKIVQPYQQNPRQYIVLAYYLHLQMRRFLGNFKLP